jgi:hypothetical protein
MHEHTPIEYVPADKLKAHIGFSVGRWSGKTECHKSLNVFSSTKNLFLIYSNGLD